MPYLARENGGTAVYIIDELSLTKCQVTKPQRAALVAVGMPSTTVVAAGTLAAFKTLTAPILPAIAAAGDEDTALSSLVQLAVTAALRTNGVIK